MRAPLALIYPGFPHPGQNYRQVTVELGAGVQVVVSHWDACKRGCRDGSVMASHEAGQDVRLRVPDERHPHCGSCDCLPYREVVLTGEMVAALKAALP